MVTAVLGGPVLTYRIANQSYGTIFATGCGLLSLPSETGGISGNPTGTGADPRDNNFVFSPQPISVAVTITGVPISIPALSSYGAADGSLTAGAQPLALAANGGLQAYFRGGAKATSNFAPAIDDLLSAAEDRRDIAQLRRRRSAGS